METRASKKNSNINFSLSLPDKTNLLRINDDIDKKMCNCLKAISSVSRHQCIQPSYRSFSNSNGDLYLLKTKGFLKIKYTTSDDKIFNRTFEHLWNI